MKVNANSIKVGNVIIYQNQLWNVLKKDHTMPGKGGAFVQLELKDIVNGTKNNIRFRSSENIEKAYLEDKKFQYQYDQGDEIVVMDMRTYEMENFPKDLLGDLVVFLQDEMEITVNYCQDNPISISLPDTVICEIKETQGVVKGQTVTSSYKPAILDNDVTINVPQFVNAGDKVVVKTEDLTYVERAK